jgi:serine protease inhibitor
MRFAHLFVGGLLAATTAGSLVHAGSPSRREPWLSRDATIENLRVARPFNTFGMKVFDRMLAGANANVLLSPYSLGAALEMLTLGAEGQTAKVLKGRAGKTPDAAMSTEDQVKLQRALAAASSGDLTLRLANSAWLQAKAELRPTFTAAIRETYDAQSKTVDFAVAATGDEINAWVKGATQDAIPKIVDGIDPRTEFMLINATLFKGKWAVPFDAAGTKGEPFTRADGSKHDVPMMNAALKLRYAATPRWHAVAIPYVGSRFEMLVITAQNPAKTQAVRRELSRRNFIQALDGVRMEERDVILKLPRFKAEFGTDLTPVMARLGLGAAFGPGADYRGITPAPLHGLTLIQRAMVDVNEQGTEAAAVTAVTATRSLEAVVPVTFAADRPFVFGIIDSVTGAVLFVGYVADPVT